MDWASPFSEEAVEEGEGMPFVCSGMASGMRLEGTPSERFICSTREEVRPGYRRPTYAPRVMRSSSVSPGRSASRERERILPPKTMARCSFVSTLFLYTCSHISWPVVVGIRARTSQATSGSFSNSSGRSVREAVEVSTGMERGGRGWEGVEVPGVAGGVKAGLIIDGRGSCDAFDALFRIAFFPISSSELWSSNGSRRLGSGEYSGGSPGEACEGSEGMAINAVWSLKQLVAVRVV